MRNFTNKKNLRSMALGFLCLLQLVAIKVDACSLTVTPVLTYNCTGNGKDGVVTLTMSGGSEPYIILVAGVKTSVSINQAQFTGLASGTFSYTVTDLNLCIVSGSVTVGRNTLPSAKVAANKSICAGSGASVSLGATAVTGNTYSWVSNPSGFTSSFSNPSISPTSTATYTLTETNANGCSKSNSVTISVLPIPTVAIGASNNTICVGGNGISLQGSPAGGTYTGDGVTDSTFDPQFAGVGNHTVSYTYTSGNGCVNSATTVITVLPIPNVTIKSPVTTICIDGGAFKLSGAPYGGIFSGDGISDSTFDPSSAGIGAHTISYFYTNGAGCSFNEQITLTVNPLPNTVLNPVIVCLNNGKFNIASSPSGAGSIYSGDGVSGNVFDPVAAGVGDHTINFSYTDSNGCSNAASATFTVNPLPSTTLSSFSAICADATAFTLSGGSPTGGVYSGDGISGGTFDPSVAGAGSHTVTYTYTSSTTGCTSTATQPLVENALPKLSFSSKSVCIAAGTVTLDATPAGGTYSGDGVTGTSFDPTAVGAGTHTISYAYTDQNGCSNSTSATYTVVSPTAITMTTYAPVCINGGTVTLSATPSGGVFSGKGVSSGVFDPSVTGAGTFTIYYTYTDANVCKSMGTTTIVVNTPPTVTIGSQAALCAGAGSVTLSGSPSGGVFSGNGVSGSTFNPANAGAGTQTVSYTYTDANGCSSTATTNIVVNALPTVSISSISPVCVNGGKISLSASPSGGTFSGTGVSGSTFDPSVSGVGTFAINYSYTDGNGCTATATTNATVNPLPTVTLSAVSSTCTSCGKATLTGSPSGGTYSGTGVSGSTFDPSVSGTGTFTIKYTYSDANGCSASATTSITVTTSVSVSIASHAPVCINAGSFTMSGSPSGGTFSGDGVSGSTFSPSSAGAGNHTIKYTYGSSSASTVFTVNALPTVTISSHAAVCISAGSFTLSGSPSGGTFSGDGVSGSTFTPASAKTGSHVITYTYTDGNSCANSASTTIVVNALPTVTLASHAAVCLNASAFSLSGSPSGGTYSGDGVSGSTFTPANAKVGSHVITYTYSDGNGCANSATTTIVVNSVPVVSISSHAAVCGNASAFTLTGSPSGGTFSGDAMSGNTFTPANTTAGSHTITYTYSNGGCSVSASTSITVNAVPTVTIASHAAVCLNSNSFSLSGSPSGGTFSGDGVSKGNFSPSAAGVGSHVITYSYTNATGCSGSATTTIVVSAAPSASVTANGPTSFCAGGSVTLTASSGASSYSWSTSCGPILGASKQSLTVTASGTYYVTASNNGCSSTSNGTLVTVNAIPVASAGKDVSYNYGYDNCPTLTGSSSLCGSTYLWSTGATTKSTSVCPSTTTTYWFTATNNGCTSNKDYITVNVLDVRCHENHDRDENKKVHMCHWDNRKGYGQICVDKDDVPDHYNNGDKFDNCNPYGATSQDIEIQNEVKVFPNPFTSTTTVSVLFAHDSQVGVELWSLDGKMINNIYTGDVTANMTYDFKLDASGMNPGIYIVRVISGDHVDYRKINLVR